MLTISFNNVEQNSIRIRMIDVQGKLVYAAQFNSTNSPLQLSVADLENGIYFIEVITNDKVQTEKFMLAR
jgi:hypothetical protein